MIRIVKKEARFPSWVKSCMFQQHDQANYIKRKTISGYKQENVIINCLFKVYLIPLEYNKAYN